MTSLISKSLSLGLSALLLGTAVAGALAQGTSPKGRESGTQQSARYSLNVWAPQELQLGGQLDQYGSYVVILRPSPGDDYWYRLPHTIEMTGALPAGVELVQKGTDFGSLAHFEGTPTELGAFTVQLRGVMEDGQSTTTSVITMVVSDPRLTEWKATPYGFDSTRKLRVGMAAAGFGVELQSPTTWARLRVPLSLEAEGLPEGVELVRDSQGGYSLQGQPTTAGVYACKLRFSWLDGGLVDEVNVSVQVVGEDYVPAYTLGGYLGQAFRVNRAVEPGWNFFYVDDEFGARHNDAVITVAGLPKGIVWKVGEPGSFDGLSGVPEEAGVFEFTAKATLPDGGVTPEAKFTITVLDSIPAERAAGTYDCLVQREEANDGNGGRLLVSLTRTGKLSGYLIHNFQRYPFTPASATYADTGALRIAPPKSGVVFEGQVQDEGWYGDERLMLTGLLRRSVSSEDDSSPGNGAWVSGHQSQVRIAADPSPFAGPDRVNMIFVRNPWSDESQPAGTGFLSFKVAASGVVTGTFWAADGSAPVSVATRISEYPEGGRFPLYLITTNDSGRASLSGEIFLNANSDAAGTANWYQAPSDRGSFPGGIAMVNYTGVIGSRYAAQPDNLNLLGLEEGILNAELELEGAGLVDELDVPLTVSNNAIVVGAAPPPAVSGVKVKLDKKTGIVTGSLKVKTGGVGAAKTVQFRAMLDPQNPGAVGHFTLRGASRGVKAGAVRIAPRAE